MSDLLADMRFHHIGVACQDLDRAEAPYAAIGYRAESEDFSDPLQGVRGRFLVNASGPRLELMQALPGSTVLEPWLQGPSRMYHLAFETAELITDLERFRNARAHVVVNPVPAVAFGGREIAFVMLSNQALVELISSV